MGNYTKLINNIQIICFSMFIILWYINETRQTGKIYAIAFLIIFAVIEIINILKKKKCAFGKPLFVLFIFMLFCFLSSIWAIDSSYSLAKAIDVLFEFGFIFLGLNFLLRIENGEKKLINIIMITGILFSIYIISYYGINVYFKLLLKGKRVGGDIANVNAIGIKTSIAFLICVFYGLYKNKKIYYLISIIPLIVALGTGSKKVLIMITFGIFIIFYRRMKHINNYKQLIKFLLIFIIVICAIIIIIKMPYFKTLFNRFEIMLEAILGTENDSNSSTVMRKAFINKGFETFLKNPLLGIGAGNAGFITIEVSGIFTYLHNNYIELLATLGIIGFSLYYYSYFYIIRSYFKNKNSNDIYFDLVFIIFIVNIISEIGVVTYTSIGTSLYLLLGYLFCYKGGIKTDE